MRLELSRTKLETEAEFLFSGLRGQSYVVHFFVNGTERSFKSVSPSFKLQQFSLP